MSQSQDDAITRAAGLIADALSELTAAGKDNTFVDELARQRAAIESLRDQAEQRLADDRLQRDLLAQQITHLATSLDRLVTHLETMSGLMSDLVQRLSAPVEAPETLEAAPDTGEPPFRAGGEGISLGIGEVPGFQVLMDIQKALMAMEQVSSASVERFQEGESRIQIHLRGPVTATQVANALGSATGHSFAVEESRPELMRLRLKIVG